jgi:hypothetical protein
MKTISEIQNGLQAPLRSNEIELRVGRKSKDGKSVTLLCYKDARCDAKRLDEVVGIFGWKREHGMIDGKNYCTVSVKNPESGEWVSKQDCGVESKTEATKGESSDAFKRACFAWGIGRELYDMPTITIPAEYEYKLAWVEIKLAYFEGTKEVAAMQLHYSGKSIFTYKSPNYTKESKVYAV